MGSDWSATLKWLSDRFQKRNKITYWLNISWPFNTTLIPLIFHLGERVESYFKTYSGWWPEVNVYTNPIYLRKPPSPRRLELFPQRVLLQLHILRHIVKCHEMHLNNARFPKWTSFSTRIKNRIIFDWRRGAHDDVGRDWIRFATYGEIISRFIESIQNSVTRTDSLRLNEPLADNQPPG